MSSQDMGKGGEMDAWPRLFDAHCHLDWFSDPSGVAAEAAEKNLGLLAVTVTPGGYLRARDVLLGFPNVRLAAGLHPWWVRERDPRVDELCDLVSDLRWIGEIGLDASPRRAHAYAAQLSAFERICATCAETSDAAEPKVLSIHAVRATGDALDVLERTGAAASCRCVLHWFSGTSEELWRAVRLGCRFSLGERSLGTRRGREHARILPAELLLTETDLPPEEGSTLAAGDVRASLERAVSGIAAARGMAEQDLHALLAANATALT